MYIFLGFAIFANPNTWHGQQLSVPYFWGTYGSLTILWLDQFWRIYPTWDFPNMCFLCPFVLSTPFHTFPHLSTNPRLTEFRILILISLSVHIVHIFEILWVSKTSLGDICIPIGSMYAIYGNIYHKYTPHVSIYIAYMDPMGYVMSACIPLRLPWYWWRNIPEISWWWWPSLTLW